jgi:hypothetical protein
MKCQNQRSDSHFFLKLLANCDQLKMEWNMPKKTKAIISVEAIASKITILRGERVILDRDLAEMYGVETRVLK